MIDQVLQFNDLWKFCSKFLRFLWNGNEKTAKVGAGEKRIWWKVQNIEL